jgi:hypothetical protein
VRVLPVVATDVAGQGRKDWACTRGAKVYALSSSSSSSSSVRAHDRLCWKRLSSRRLAYARWLPPMVHRVVPVFPNVSCCLLMLLPTPSVSVVAVGEICAWWAGRGAVRQCRQCQWWCWWMPMTAARQDNVINVSGRKWGRLPNPVRAGLDKKMWRGKDGKEAGEKKRERGRVLLFLARPRLPSLHTTTLLLLIAKFMKPPKIRVVLGQKGKPASASPKKKKKGKAGRAGNLCSTARRACMDRPAISSLDAHQTHPTHAPTTNAVYGRRQQASHGRVVWVAVCDGYKQSGRREHGSGRASDQRLATRVWT